jgi:excisionase family DNA binding protein
VPVNRRWYTPTEVAKACHVSRQAVWKWLQRGALTGFRPNGGKWWRVTASEFERYVRARAKPVGEKPAATARTVLPR